MEGRLFELRSMKRHAITSYGVILFTVVKRKEKNEIRYQIQQRRGRRPSYSITSKSVVTGLLKALSVVTRVYHLGCFFRPDPLRDKTRPPDSP